MFPPPKKRKRIRNIKTKRSICQQQQQQIPFDNTHNSCSNEKGQCDEALREKIKRFACRKFPQDHSIIVKSILERQDDTVNHRGNVNDNVDVNDTKNINNNAKGTVNDQRIYEETQINKDNKTEIEIPNETASETEIEFDVVFEDESTIDSHIEDKLKNGGNYKNDKFTKISKYNKNGEPKKEGKLKKEKFDREETLHKEKLIHRVINKEDKLIYKVNMKREKQTKNGSHNVKSVSQIKVKKIPIKAARRKMRKQTRKQSVNYNHSQTSLTYMNDRKIRETNIIKQSLNRKFQWIHTIGDSKNLQGKWTFLNGNWENLNRNLDVGKCKECDENFDLNCDQFDIPPPILEPEPKPELFDDTFDKNHYIGDNMGINHDMGIDFMYSLMPKLEAQVSYN